MNLIPITMENIPEDFPANLLENISMSDQVNWWDRVEKARARKGWNRSELARKAGVKYDLLSKWLKGGVAQPRAKALSGLAQALGVSEQWILYGETSEEPSPDVAGKATSDVDMSTMRTGGLVGGGGFPIYASAQGGPTGMTVSFEPIEHAKWPEPLMGVKGGFGMYVVGDSMEPAYWQGDMILVHPTKPARNGDDVLVVKSNDNSEHPAMIKRLVKGDGDKIVVKQYNPDDEFPIPRSEIHGVYLIVGSYKRR